MSELEPVPPAYVPYATFGERFFELAVTEERLTAAVGTMAGDPIAFGPIGAGPGRVAQVSAAGEIGRATASRQPGEDVCFRLSIPVSLELLIVLGVDRHRFAATLDVTLMVTARAAEPLRIVIDIEEPTWRDVQLTVEAGSRRATLLQRVSGLDRELATFVARFVAREIDKPRARAMRDIDVLAQIDAAFGPGGTGPSGSPQASS